MQTLQGAVSEFLQYMRIERNCSPNTTRTYAVILRTFMHFLKLRHPSIELTLIQPEHIRQYMAYLFVSKRYAATSVKQSVITLRSLFRFLLDYEHLVRNPMLKIRSPKTEERLPEVLSEDELNCLLAGLDTKTWQDKRNRAIIVLLATTGIRLNELVGLNLKDIMMQNSTGKIRVLGKGARERYVPLHAMAMSALQDYFQCRPQNSNGAAFLNRFGKRLWGRWIQRVLLIYGKRAGIRHLKPHTLRHTFATLLDTNGVSLRVIQLLLGHRSLTSTQIYLQVNPDRFQGAIDQLIPDIRQDNTRVLGCREK